MFNNWCCFDYIVYVMWLIECRDAKLKKLDVSASCGITEELFAHKHNLLTIEKDCSLHWTSRKQVSTDDSKIIMRFHLDRQKAHDSILRRPKNAIKRLLRMLKLRR